MEIKIEIPVPTGVTSMDVYKILDALPSRLELILQEATHLAFGGWDVIFPKGADTVSVKTMILGIPVSPDCLSCLTDKVLVFESNGKKENN